MLELKGIKKDYSAGENVVHALKGVSLDFRKNEFVAVLGQSGCGKTTMLNIIGGLDHYTDGDLVINGKSTKDFTERDWDSYRNHSIGFVFQSYNLIPHQSVLQNVEIALALSGVSKAERRERAKQALAAVGLETQIHKKPSEMSGGQMQRVAIARALVNNPDIILADEPTGALDSETSVQVMEILKEVAKDRLVIMVTHNPDLADEYATRIVRMLDGLIIDDTAPLSEAEKEKERLADEKQRESELITDRKGRVKKERKPSMSLLTSFGLSLKNLFTKKGRTMLTSFAGSIGIIGIALIYAVSQGTTAYIDYVQETTLASYPLTLESTTVDLSTLMNSFMNVGKGELDHEKDAIYKDPMIAELVEALANTETNENDLKAFKAHLEAELKTEDSKLAGALSGVQYGYRLQLPIYTENVDGTIIKSDTNALMMEMLGDYMMAIAAGGKQEENSTGDSAGGNMMMSSMMNSGMWQEMLSGLDAEKEPINKMIYEQYELIDGGSWPNEYDEIVLIVNERNELDDLTLFALGLLSQEEIDAIIHAAANGETVESNAKRWTYEEIRQRTFRTILPADFYQPVGDIYADMSNNDGIIKMLYEKTDLKLKVTGIIRPREDADTTMLSSGIGYTSALTKYVIEAAKDSAVVKAQLADPTVDVLTGLPFEAVTGIMTSEEKAEAFKDYVAGLKTSKEKANVFKAIQCVEAEEASLEMMTDNALAQMQDKESVVLMISQQLSQQTGMSVEELAKYFEDITLDELKNMLRSSIEEQMKAVLAENVEKGLLENFSKFDESGKVTLDEEKVAMALDMAMQGYTAEQCAKYYEKVTEFSSSTYEENLVKFGCLDLDSPSTISLYASSFEKKDIIEEVIAEYNKTVDESKQISYTDYMGIMMSSITTIIDAITYVLIAFVAVSLIVSSIMIGVITLISVQERTKEIGILRALGASKRNVSSMFNAETVIIGFSSGLLGVLITYLLCIPINAILNALTGLSHLKAFLPIQVAIILVAISVLLTLIAGIIPSRSAAKKDPVVALRTE